MPRKRHTPEQIITKLRQAEVALSTGGIGIVVHHADMSRAEDDAGVTHTLITAGKHKAELNPFEPASAEALAALQERADTFFSMFVSAVARGRDVTTSEVRGCFGAGRMVGAVEAVRLGMADRVGTLDQVIGRLVGSRSSRGMAATGPDAGLLAEAYELAG